MASEAQIQANRSNAQHSTGPTSEQGKAMSALNAMSHGFYSKHLLLPSEDPNELELLRSGLIESYQPVDATELLYVERIIASEWKLRRLDQLEAQVLKRRPEGYMLKDLERLSRMAQSLDRTIHRAAKALCELQKQRERSQSEPAREISRNEPNSPPKASAASDLEPQPDDLSDMIKMLTQRLSHDLPSLAASAVVEKAAKPGLQATGSQ